MRILFSFAGGHGHFAPLLPTARAMAVAGHEIAFAAQSAMVPSIARSGFDAFDAGGTTFPDQAMRSPLLELDMDREYLAVRDGYAGRIARQRAPALLALASRWKPDLLVCDEMDFGGMIAAERSSIPHATVIVTASGLLARKDMLAEPLGLLRAEHGLNPDPELEMLSRFLVLVPFPASLRDPTSPLPPTAYPFRQAMAARDEPPAWLAELPARPTVYVTLGTVFNVESGDLFIRLLAGIASLPVNVIATVGPQIDPAELGPQPENVRIERYVDQWSLLSCCDLVVSHAGSGTIFGALAHGLPMLLLPMGADQLSNGRRCEALGAARLLDPVGSTPDLIGDAATALLNGDNHRRAARLVQNEIERLPSHETAVALLTDLARTKAPFGA